MIENKEERKMRTWYSFNTSSEFSRNVLRTFESKQTKTQSLPPFTIIILFLLTVQALKLDSVQIKFKVFKYILAGKDLGV